MNIVNNKYTQNMAVDIKSLRIGSHVLWNGKRRRVDAITEDSIAFRIADTEQKMYDSATIESVEPIAITPELLKELGFEYHEYDNGNLWEWRFDDLYKAYGYLEFDDDDTLTWRGHLWHMDEIETDFCRVRYLHELENLFYVFYEKELIPD